MSTSCPPLTVPDRIATAVVVATTFSIPVVQFAGAVVWLEAGALLLAGGFLEWKRWRRRT